MKKIGNYLPPRLSRIINERAQEVRGSKKYPEGMIDE
jgi:hypothetical protein